MEQQNLEMTISNPNNGDFLKEIQWNKEEFLASVQIIADEYRGLTYTDDQIKIAKSDRAKLNAAKKRISDRRIEVKKAIMAPYDQFEAEVKEGVAKIDEVINMIDAQIREYEESKKRDKRKTLEEFFSLTAKDLDWLAFGDVFEERYLNATSSVKSCIAEIKDKIDKARENMEAVEKLDPEYRVYARDVFVRTKDIGAAMQEVARMQELKRQEEEESAKRAEAERLAEEERTRKESETADKSEDRTEAVDNKKEDWTIKSSNEQEKQEHGSLFEPQNVYKASFCVHGTLNQIEGLKQYMISNKIRFERVTR